MHSEITTNVEMLNPIQKFLGNLNLSNVTIPSIRITDIIDIIIVAIIIYTIIHWIQETRAWTLFKGLLVIICVSFLSYSFHFYTLTWIIERTLSVGIIALVIIFQPELRKALEQIGNGSFNSVTGLLQVNQEVGVISASSADEILDACVKMSNARTGALIAIEKSVPLSSVVNNSGVATDAMISSQLLINIFEDKTPLHDGAVIIRDNRIAAASCILRVTSKEIGQELGTRHRAAVGGSEDSDALFIIVSEETGKISIASGGSLRKGVSEKELKKELYSLVETTTQKPISLSTLWKGLNKNDKK